MPKRRTIRINKDVYNMISEFCKENNVSLSMFTEERVEEYFQSIRSYPIQENWAKQQSWILFVSYDGKQDQKKNELIQIVVGKHGGTTENGLAFIFDSESASNNLLAKEAKRRVLENVPNVKAEPWRYRISNGME